MQYFIWGEKKIILWSRQLCSSWVLRTVLAETPPPRAIVGILCSLAARIVLVTSTSTTAASNDAQISGMCTLIFLALQVLTWFKTAVFKPLKLKSSEFFSSHARGNFIWWGFPSSARLATWGPPGYGRPSNLATLSKASPAASSLVLPKHVNSVWLWAR